MQNKSPESAKTTLSPQMPQIKNPKSAKIPIEVLESKSRTLIFIAQISIVKSWKWRAGFAAVAQIPLTEAKENASVSIFVSLPSPRRTSWTPINPGRRFYGCTRYKEASKCKYFKWVDAKFSD